MPASAIARESGTNSEHHSARFATRVSRRIGEGTSNVIARLGARGLRHNDAGFVNLGAVLSVVGAILVGIIAAPIALNLLAGQMPNIVGSVGNITTAFKDADWGDDTANSLSPTMGMLVALTAVFAIAVLAFSVWTVAKRTKSG